MDLKHPLRLIFKPLEFDDREKIDGESAWRAIKSIEIIEIKDTHD